MKNNQTIHIEESMGNADQYEDGYNELINRIIEIAAEDLLEAMVAENTMHFNRVVILHTPTMGICNDIPLDKHGKPVEGKHFKFSESYKKRILSKFEKLSINGGI